MTEKEKDKSVIPTMSKMHCTKLRPWKLLSPVVLGDKLFKIPIATTVMAPAMSMFLGRPTLTGMSGVGGGSAGGDPGDGITEGSSRDGSTGDSPADRSARSGPGDRSSANSRSHTGKR